MGEGLLSKKKKKKFSTLKRRVQTNLSDVRSTGSDLSFPLNINRSFIIRAATRLGERVRKEIPARRASEILHSGC